MNHLSYVALASLLYFSESVYYKLAYVEKKVWFILVNQFIIN